MLFSVVEGKLELSEVNMIAQAAMIFWESGAVQFHLYGFDVSRKNSNHNIATSRLTWL
jgi:hypothetical protein